MNSCAWLPVQATALGVHGMAASRGWRINLRPLAEIQTLVWTPLFFAALWMGWHVLAFIWELIMTPYDEDYSDASAGFHPAQRMNLQNPGLTSRQYMPEGSAHMNAAHRQPG